MLVGPVVSYGPRLCSTETANSLALTAMVVTAEVLPGWRTLEKPIKQLSRKTLQPDPLSEFSRYRSFGRGYDSYSITGRVGGYQIAGDGAVLNQIFAPLVRTGGRRARSTSTNTRRPSRTAEAVSATPNISGSTDTSLRRPRQQRPMHSRKRRNNKPYAWSSRMRLWTSSELHSVRTPIDTLAYNLRGRQPQLQHQQGNRVRRQLESRRRNAGFRTPVIEAGDQVDGGTMFQSRDGCL